MNFTNIGQVLGRQRIAVVAVLVVGVALFIVALPHFRKYTAESTLLTAQASQQDGAVLDPSKDPIASTLDQNDLQGLATSSTVLTRVANDLHLTEAQAKRLPAEVKAKSIFGSDILPITVNDADPNLAVNEVNAVAKELSAFSTRVATTRYDQLVRDLTQQVADRRTALRALDRKIQGLTSANFFITAEDGTTAFNTRLIALEQQEQQLQATVDGDAANAAAFDRRPLLTKHLAAHEIVAQDPAIEALRTQYGKDLAALNNMKASYTSRYDGIAGLEDTVSREYAALNAVQKRATSDATQSASYVSAMLDANKANATLQADRAQLATVRGELAQLDGRLSASGGAGTQVAALHRERVVDEAAFGELSARLAKAIADRSQAASIGSVVVVDRAVAAHPALLGRPGVLAAAFTIVFLWLAITIAFVLDNADKRLRDATTIEDLYGKPVFTPVG
jgi:capsular polysaccharide biosynthesis protein